MGVERYSAGVVAEFRVIANSTRCWKSPHCVRICINNTAGNGVSSSEIQQTRRTITEKRSAGHIADVHTVTSAENAGRIFPSKLFLASSHICHDPAVSVIWRDKNRDVDFPRLVLPLSTALRFLTAICLGDISAESKVESSVFHPRNLTGHYRIQTSSTSISQINILNKHPRLKKKKIED